MTRPLFVVEGESPSQRLVGYRVTVHEDHSEVTLRVGEDHINRNDTLHGGLAAMLLDSAMGWASRQHLAADAPNAVVTLSLTINFVSAPRRGDVLRAVGRVVGGGHKTAFAEGRLANAETGTLIATASGVFKRNGARR